MSKFDIIGRHTGNRIGWVSGKDYAEAEAKAADSGFDMEDTFMLIPYGEEIKQSVRQIGPDDRI